MTVERIAWEIDFGMVRLFFTMSRAVGSGQFAGMIVPVILFIDIPENPSE